VSRPAKRLVAPRVTPAQIAEAALAIGLDQATIRNVADRLGMSVPGSTTTCAPGGAAAPWPRPTASARLPLPETAASTGPTWMLEYGRFVYDALVASPRSSADPGRHLQHRPPGPAPRGIFGVLTARGFSVDEATHRRRLTDAVNGAAVSQIGRRATDRRGHPDLDDLRRAVQALGRPPCRWSPSW
jgi:hypothetical protein